ncbi:MAG: MATE family efflux transporter [Kiritimatiellae bacterium]|nr:MATE family efflux transporter [Kiritimatiellia bacterium]
MQESPRLARNTKEMGGHRIIPLLIRYSIPTTIGTAAFTAYNVVDRIFIGRAAGAYAIAGISITFPLFMICIAIGMMIGIGSGTMVSIRLGEGRIREAERILGNAVALFSVLSLLLLTLGELLLIPMLNAFGASPATLPYATTYMRILLLFLPMDFLAMGMNGLLRAEGSPRISMTILLSGAMLNIVLDWVFIFPFDMGVAGAALATGLSKLFSATWILLHFTIGKHRALTLHLKNLRLSFATVLSILHIGLSPFTMQFVQSASVVFMNRSLLHYGGDTAVGAMGIIFAVQMFLLMPVMGLIHASSPILGFNYGAKKFARVREALLAALAYAFLVTLTGMALIQLFPSAIVGLFNRENFDLIGTTITGMRIFTLSAPLAAAQMMGAHYFQATGRPHLSISLHLLRQAVCYLAFLFILPRFFGLTGVWAAMPSTDVIASLITAVFILFELRRMKSACTPDRLEQTV